MDKNIVTIGGGTGLSVLLEGLKKHFTNISAIVTVADDGGSSGRLREELGMLAPGDIRNCLCALSDSEQKKIMNYRFTEGELKGHPLGNIYIAALNAMSDNFFEAVETMNRLMKTNGEVIPVTNDNINLCAYLSNGDIIWGESSIGKRIGKERIDHIELRPKHAKAVDAAIKKLIDADVIIFGPGSLYTSIIPNLLVDGIVKALRNCSAKKIYVCNIMTQPGETLGYDVYDHLTAIEKHSYEGIMDYIIANDARINGEILKRYEIEGATCVKTNKERFAGVKTNLILGELLSDNPKFLRHNVDNLIEIIKKII